MDEKKTGVNNEEHIVYPAVTEFVDDPGFVLLNADGSKVSEDELKVIDQELASDESEKQAPQFAIVGHAGERELETAGWREKIEKEQKSGNGKDKSHCP